MTAAPTPSPADGSRPPRPITPLRVLVWLAVGGAGVFLVVSGILGIISKG